MAPKKKAAAASAPASRKKPAPTAPEILDKKESAKIARAEKKEAERLERIAKRAEKSAANRLAFKESREEAKQSLHSLRAIIDQKRLGRTAPPWTDELADTLFELISTGHGMRQIDAMDGMPSLFTMLKWRQDDAHPFAKLFVRAKEHLVDLYEEEAQLAAVQPETFIQKTRKQVVTRDGDIVWVTENRIVDNVARSALKVQAYQWTLGHLKPKKHGRNPDQSTGGANEQLKGLFDALKAGPVDAPK